MPPWRRISTGTTGVKPDFDPNEENAMLSTPYEVNLGGVYFPPLLVAGSFGLLATYLLTRTLTRYRLSRFFVSPPLVFLSLTIVVSGFIESLFFIR